MWCESFSLLSWVEEDGSGSSVCPRGPALPIVRSELPVSHSLPASFHSDLSAGITRFQSFILGLPPPRDRQINLACKWFNSPVPGAWRGAHLLQAARKQPPGQGCCQHGAGMGCGTHPDPSSPPSTTSLKGSGNTACLAENSTGLDLSQRWLIAPRNFNF